MPKHDDTVTRESAEQRQHNIALLVQTGIGYGEAQAVIDTASHAVEEALTTLMTICSRNSQVLGLSNEADAACKIIALKQIAVTVTVSIDMFVAEIMMQRK